MLLALAVFLTDTLISYASWQSLDSWLMGRKLRVVAWTVGLDLAIAINTMGFVDAGWWMLVPSTLGSALGTILSFRGEEPVE